MRVYMENNPSELQSALLAIPEPEDDLNPHWH